MKTLRNIIIVLFTGLFCTVSCEDFLKEHPKGKITSEQAFSSISDIEGSVNVLYKQVGRSMFGISQFIFSQMGDDLTTHIASNKAMIRQWDRFRIDTNNDRLQLCWEDKYVVIKAANYIINGVEKTLDLGAKQADVDYALGQAYFWRAWAYFYLVRAFGPLPKITDLNLDFNVGLTNVKEIYDLVVSDLLEAEKRLLPAYTGVPKEMNGVTVVASKAAVQATLSYVYLTMAGWPLDNGTEYYKLAAAEAKKVIDGVTDGTYKYKLYDEYWKIHSRAENWKNEESILSAYFSRAWSGGDGSEAARGCINDIPDCVPGAWSDTHAEIGFYSKFPLGPRKDATYAQWTALGAAKDKVVRWWSPDVPEETRVPFFAKSAFITDRDKSNLREYNHKLPFNHADNCGGEGWGEQCHQVVRLAEVYLFYAEAVGRSNETNPLAIELLNRVRNRADGFGPVADRSTVGIPTKPHVEIYQNYYPSTMSPKDLADAAYDEHGWEIAGWYWGALAPRANDMHRMDRIKEHFEERKQTSKKYTFVFTGLNYDGDATETFTVEASEKFGTFDGDEWKQSKMFAPYPEVEVNRNPKLGFPVEDKLNMIK